MTKRAFGNKGMFHLVPGEVSKEKGLSGKICAFESNSIVYVERHARNNILQGTQQWLTT